MFSGLNNDLSIWRNKRMYYDTSLETFFLDSSNRVLFICQAFSFLKSYTKKIRYFFFFLVQYSTAENARFRGTG